MRVLLAFAPDEPATRAEVVRLLSDPHHRMRASAANWAGDFLVREAEPLLRKMAESEAYGAVKGAAKGALEKLAKPVERKD